MKKNAPLPVGKLPNELLQKLLDKLAIKDSQVVLGPAVGEDAAVIKTGNRLLVAKTDPVTLASDLIGWYAVHVNANDIATRGLRPRWFMATVLLQEGSTAQEAEKIFDQIHSACNSLDIALVGGHTEITYGLKRPIVVGCMLAETDKKSVISTAGAEVGDDIVLTKGIAIEGTAALAREVGDKIGLNKDSTKRAADYLFAPGISVVKEAMLAADVAHSMHDPTEGGLATGLWEVAAAAGVGLIVEKDKIPILTECREICRALKLDPMGLLASGALIITVPPAKAGGLVKKLNKVGVNASVIGRVVDAEEGVKIRNNSGTEELPRFKRDELARYLESLDRKRTN